jgi:hypothetical protein
VPEVQLFRRLFFGYMTLVGCAVWLRPHQPRPLILDLFLLVGPFGIAETFALHFAPQDKPDHLPCLAASLPAS